MQNSQITDGHPLANEVKINLNMLGMLVVDWVGGHVYCTDVVTVHQCGATERGVKLLKELAQPCGLSNNISHGAVLGFSTGSGDGGLTLRGPGDEVSPRNVAM